MSMIGREISHYRIENRVGGGGMGVIYRARDLLLDRTVVLKFLPPQLSDDGEAKEAFLREAQAASALDHPNICTVFEVGETNDGQLFIAMASYEGETLEQKVRRLGPLPIDQAVDLTRQAAEGLARSHDRDIVHRDIKPANLFLTDEGRLKILDFGLAKVLGQGSSLPGLTQGTPAYMAPEQIRGSAPNPRNDLWALGAVLYELLTGRRAFGGESVPEIVAKIFDGPPPPIQHLRPEVPPGLALVVDHLLAHEPAERYGSCAELLADISPETTPSMHGDGTSTTSIPALRTGSSGAVAPPPLIASPSRPRRPLSRVGALALLFVAVALWAWWTGINPSDGPGHDSAGGPATVAEGDQVTEPRARTTLAVLFFDNLSGNPDLDWLRTALADMLVTDLSQSNSIEVVSTAQLYRALESNVDPTADQLSSTEMARRLVERLSVDRLVMGSVVESGGTLRIQIQIQEAGSGRIIDSRRVEGDGQKGLFSMVDSLSHGIRQQLEMPDTEEPRTDREIADLTTKSLEALRFYTEGMRLHLQFKEAEAAELFGRATEIDPDFGMAWAKLAVTARNLGRPEAREYAKRALDTALLLDPRERFYIEGFHHGYRLEDWGRAVTAFEKAIELDPDFHSARQNLLVFYGALELGGDAIRHGEELLARGARSRGAAAALAERYTERNEVERAEGLLLDFLRRRPEDFAAHSALGWFYLRVGRLELAREHLETADRLRPGEIFNHAGLYSTYLLAGDWAAVDSLSEQARLLAEPALGMLAERSLMIAALFRGRSAEALARAEALASHLPPEHGATFHLWAGRIRLERHEPTAARHSFEAALAQSAGGVESLDALFWDGMAALALGDRRTAEGRAEELSTLASALPGSLVSRRHAHLLAHLALADDDLEGARYHLEAAVSTLPPRDVWTSVHLPDHVPLRWSLAQLYRRLGEPGAELGQLQAIEATHEGRLLDPITWVRSLHRLGQIHHQWGDPERAAAYERRIAALWSDADLELEPSTSNNPK